MNYLAFLAALDQWVAANSDIHAAALVGSYVREGQASEPDVDVVLLSTRPELYRHPSQWLSKLFPDAQAVQVTDFDDRLSIRFALGDFTAELNISPPEWARLPAMPETALVARASLTLLKDNHQSLERLQQGVADAQVISVRNGEITDAPLLSDIFYRAIHAIDEALYSPEQKQAWAPEPDADSRRRWQQRIVDQKPFVALVGDQLAGFMTIEPDGLIDLFFVDPDYQHQGVGEALYHQVLKEATNFGLSELTVEASKAAQPFFQNRGFSIRKVNEVSRHGVTLENATMHYSIKAD